MDFSAPYRVISPTLEGPILRALGGAATALTRSQILSLIDDASEAGVRKALGRLVEQGIVIEERIGSRYTYAANREHLLWPSVEGLFGARDLLRNKVRDLTAGWAIPPVSIELFGSVAQGVSDHVSDVDILVIASALRSDEEETWEQQIADLRDNVGRWTGSSCDVVVLDPDDLVAAVDRDDPILRSAMSNLAGAGLAEARRELDAGSRSSPALRAVADAAAMQQQVARLSATTASFAAAARQTAVIAEAARKVTPLMSKDLQAQIRGVHEALAAYRKIAPTLDKFNAVAASLPPAGVV